MMAPIGRAQRLQDLASIFRERRIGLGLNQRVVEQSAGLADGYVGKLEVGVRGIGVESCNALLAALGLEMVIFPAGGFEELTGSKLGAAPTILTAELAAERKNRVRRARLGGLTSSSNMTREQRVKRAKKAGVMSGKLRRRKAQCRGAAKKALQYKRARLIEAAEQKADAGFFVLDGVLTG